MATEWNTVCVEDAPLEIIDGDRGTNYPKQDDFNPSGHCLFLNAGNVTREGFDFGECAFISAERDAMLRKGKLRRYDVILTTRGTVGNVAFFNDSVPFEHMRINSGMVILRTRSEQLLPQYLYLFLRSACFREQARALSTGSAQPQLPIRDIRKIKIPIPSFDAQRAIAYLVGLMDDRVDLGRQMLPTLRAFGQAFFKSWFTRFDPVWAEMEKRKANLPKQLEGLFSRSFEESPLGRIPTGWTAGTLGDICTQRRERVGKRGAVVLSAVASGKLVRAAEHFSKQVHSDNTEKYLAVEEFDFAYNPSRINIGSIGMLQEPALGAVSPVYVVFRPKKEYRWLIAFFLELSSTRSWINALASGSVRQSLSFDSFASIPLVIPPASVVVEFNEQWDLMSKALVARDAESRTLAALRDLIVADVLFREPNIPDVSHLIGGKA